MALSFLPVPPTPVAAPAAPLSFKPTTPVPTPVATPPVAPAAPAPGPTLADLLNTPPSPPKSKADQRRAKIEAEIGEQVGMRTRSPEEVLAIMRDGVLVEVVVKRWRGTTRLKANELGITDPKMVAFAEQRLSLGVKHLIPKVLAKDLEAAEVAARQALYAAGLKTSYGRFVPTHRFRAFREIFEQAEERFNAKLAELCDKLDVIKNNIRDEYVPLAQQAWQGERTGWNGGSHAIYEVAPPEFVASFVEKVVAQVPSAAEIMQQASFTYHLNILNAPDTTLAAQFASSDQAVNEELTQHLSDRKKEFIDDFLRSIRDGLADSVQKMVEEVHKTTDGKEHIHGKTLGKILKAISDLKDLNITQDMDIEEVLTGLSSYIDTKKNGKEKVSTAEVVEQLKLASAKIVESSKTKTATMFHGM